MQSHNGAERAACSESALAEPAAIERIYLTGFMGAGKSTVGALLARDLRWRVADTDLLVEEQSGSSISALFASQGESAFRQLEAEILHGLQAEQKMVISLGGGAVETPEVRSLLASDTGSVLIFLDAPLTRLMARCNLQEGAVRPLLRDATALQARFEKRMEYYKTAHLTIATQELNPEEVAASILKHMAALARWK